MDDVMSSTPISTRKSQEFDLYLFGWGHSMSPTLNKVFEIFGKEYSKWIRLEKTKDLLIELKSYTYFIKKVTRVLILTGVKPKVKSTDGNTRHFYYMQNTTYLIQFYLTFEL